MGGCASTDRRLVQTNAGRIAVGWLVVEDLAMVLVLVLLPALEGVLGGTQAGRVADTGIASFFEPNNL
jgi:predicted Kef-type K+ transport protein